MKIIKRRVISINDYTRQFKSGELIHVACRLSEFESSELVNLGFSSSLSVGETILPRVVGPVSNFNTNGGEIVHKDQPKEKKYFSSWIKDWHGYYHEVDIPRMCYPRTEIDAPTIEISIVEIREEKFIVSHGIVNLECNHEQIKLVINLFLELFGQCELFDEKFEPLIRDVPVKRVNWQVLPEGEYPWQKLASLAGGSGNPKDMDGHSEMYRITTVLKYAPDLLVYGNGGFYGYLVFVFKNKNLVVMENIKYGNATYIFDRDWESISQLSKGEIIHQNLMKYRLPHGKRWKNQISKVLK